MKTNATEPLHKVRELEKENDKIIFMEKIKVARNQSKIEGKLEGEKEKAFSIAKAMLQEGDPVEKIVRITGLYIKQVEKLIQAD